MSTLEERMSSIALGDSNSNKHKNNNKKTTVEESNTRKAEGDRLLTKV